MMPFYDGDSMIAGIDERKMSSKRLIKVRYLLVPILEKKPRPSGIVWKERKLLTNCWS